MSTNSHKTNLEVAIKQLSDVIDVGGLKDSYHLFLVDGIHLTIVERITNGRPEAYDNSKITPDFIRNTSKDAHNMHAMLVAEYKRYGPGGAFPSWHANLWLVRTVDIASFTFPNLKAPGAGVR